MDKYAYFRMMGIQKEAQAAYTPYQWRKYTTPEERQAIQQAERRVASIFNGGPLLGGLKGAVAAGGAIPGWLTAAITPSWQLKDLQQLGQDKNYVLKSLLIPGYSPYKDAKALGLILRIRSRVKQKVAQEKLSKQNKNKVDKNAIKQKKVPPK